jgi:hypothetical protein
MDETSWLAASDLWTMLRFLQRKRRASARKLRLFAVACCHRLWPVLLDARCRKSVESAEAFAEGKQTVEQLREARTAAKAAHRSAQQQWVAEQWPDSGPSYVAVTAYNAATLVASGRATNAAYYTLSPSEAAASGGRNHKEGRNQEKLAHGALLRCVFGNPFHPLRPRSFAVHVIALAQCCYEAYPQVSSDYLVLADALAELGVEQAAVHCREPLHAKGCHVLDWILSKE